MEIAGRGGRERVTVGPSPGWQRQEVTAFDHTGCPGPLHSAAIDRADRSRAAEHDRRRSWHAMSSAPQTRTDMAQLRGPSSGPARAARRVSSWSAARGGRRWARPHRAGASARPRPAACAVRGTRRAAALRPRSLWPPVVQPPGPPAGGAASRHPADRPAGGRLPRRGAGREMGWTTAPWPCSASRRAR